MSERGTYGKARIGADVYYVDRGASWGTWLVGGLLVGGAVLWAKHQADQINRLSAAAGLPQQSFTDSLRARTREISSATSAKLHGLSRRLGAGKEGT